MSQKIIEKANQLRDGGKTKEAAKLLMPLTKAKSFEVAVNANISLGICYTNEGLYQKAIDCYKRAYVIADKNKWMKRLGGICRDIAIASKNAKKNKDAEKWFIKSVELIKKYSDEGQGKPASLGITYSKLGLLYTETKKLSKAEIVFDESQKLLKKTSHDYWKLIGGLDFCAYLLATKEYRDAQKILDVLVSEAIAQEKEYKLIEAFILSGETEMGLKNKAAAKKYYSMAKLTLKIFDSPLVRKKFEKEIDKRLNARG